VIGRRLSLRSKLTLIFAGVMAMVLVAGGSFLFFRTKASLDGAIRESLRTRAGDLVQSIHSHDLAETSPGNLIEHGERFAQVLTPAGQVLDSHPQGAPALLRRAELRPGSRRQGFIDRGEENRLLVTPVRNGNRELLAVVDASLADREHALEGLERAMFIGGPLVLLLASALAYWIATAALQPVELMRRRAREITSADPAALLPVPASRDEIHRLATTLNEMLSRLSKSAEHEREFVANASHELRTPIATIRTELELALRNATTVEEFRQAAELAIADADELASLAGDLLVLARTDGRAMTLDRRDVDIDELLRAIADEVERDPLLGPRQLRRRDTGLHVVADPDRLTQALRNMVRNAVLHGAGTITLGATAETDTIAIWVGDEGESLPEDLRVAAFERFTRGRQAGNRPGAGLGLAIVREIADLHEGRAQLVNVDGGVRCELEIPVVEPAGREPARRQPSTARIDSKNSRSGSEPGSPPAATIASRPR
jgi:two-component system OmpR family sensor kinase